MENDELRRHAIRQPVIRSGSWRDRFAPKGCPINCTLVARTAAIARINGWASSYVTSCDLEMPTRAWYAGLKFVYDASIVAIRRLNGRSLSRGPDRGMGTDFHSAARTEWLRRYVHYERHKDAIDWRNFGDLHEADPELTVEVPNG